jgi:hypothetical protein
VAPQPISALTQTAPLRGILCDIDDTLTIDGRIVPAALMMLRRAQEAGLQVVPVTGRPGGWADQIARMWPVDGVIGENGGLWFWRDGQKLQRRFLQGADERELNRARLKDVAKQILAEVPGCALASDQPYRDLDLAIDFCEDVPSLPEEAIDQIVSIFKRNGATCKVSSIHVNGWFGAFDKLTGFKRFHQDRYGSPPDFSEWAFFGDSANDEPMFKAFPLSIGVANVELFLPRMTHHPAWIASEEGGDGFCESLYRILKIRENSNA